MKKNCCGSGSSMARNIGCSHRAFHADALAKTDSESIAAIVRKRGILFAEFAARMGQERLPRRVMLGKLVTGKGYSGGHQKDRMVRLEEDITEVGMKFEGADRWFRRVEEGREAFVRKWHRAESCRTAEGHAEAAKSPPIVVLYRRRMEGGKGGRPVQETEV